MRVPGFPTYSLKSEIQATRQFEQKKKKKA